MNQGGIWLDGYSIARDSLADAMEVLHKVSADGFILVGAQAVYLHTSHIRLPVAPFTLDGDIVVDPRKVRKASRIQESLEIAGFTLRGHNGLYNRADAPPEYAYATRIDVFVPARFESDWDFEAYSYRDAQSVMPQAGLELSLVDHAPIRLEGTASGQRDLVVEVAGPSALLVAKGWKIGERHEQGAEAFAEVRKDVLDVYRLLRASEPEEIAKRLTNVPREPRFVDTAKAGTAYLRSLCGTGGEALNLVTQLLGSSREALEIAASLPILVEEFCELVAETL